MTVYALRTSNTIHEKKEYGEARTHYSIYLDGQLADYGKIDISKYSMEINDEQQEIYLSSNA